MAAGESDKPVAGDPILTDAAEPHGGPSFIARHRRELSLRDGSRISVRPLAPDDKAALRAGFARLSDTSRYRRFLAPATRLPERLVDYFTEIDYQDHFAWAAFSLTDPGSPGVAVARYVRDPDHPDRAEPAVTVIDDYQGRGLGALMLQLLATTAAEHGIRRFSATVLRDNHEMRALLEKAGARFAREEPGVLQAEIDLPNRDRARSALMLEVLRHARAGALAGAEWLMLPPDAGVIEN